MTVWEISLAGAITALGLAGGAGIPAPSVNRYRMDLKGEQVLDLSGMQQPDQRQNYGMSSFIVVSLRDTVAGRAVDVTLDSMQVDSGSPIPPVALDSARGATWHALLSRSGKLSGLTPGAKGGASGQVEGLLWTFFPRVGMGVQSGDTWTDTTAYQVTDGPATFAVRVVTNYSAAATEPRNGIDALRVQAAFSSSRSGAVETSQGQMNVDGAGTGTGTYYVTRDGGFLGGETVEQATLNVTSPSLQRPLPIRSTSTITITRLP